MTIGDPYLADLEAEHTEAMAFGAIKTELLDAMRDIIEAGEAAGWDTDPQNAPILNRAREAYYRAYNPEGDA